MMGKLRRLESKSLIDQNLQGRVGEVILSPDHMGDLHQMIIDDHRKIVGGNAVRTDDDKISHRIGIKFHGPANQILEGDPSRSDLEAVGRLSSRFRHCLFCLIAQIPAFAHVPGHHFSEDQFGPLSLQFLFGTVTGINTIRADQYFQKILVYIESFALMIRPAFSAFSGAFIPVNGKPVKILLYSGFKSLCRPERVRILNAEDEISPKVPRKQPVEQRCSGIADMKISCGRWCKPDPWSYGDHSSPLFLTVTTA